MSAYSLQEIASDPGLSLLEAKLPPHSDQAEQAVLCACLQKPWIIHQAATLLKPEHFYRGCHQLIFAAMSELCREGLGQESFIVAVPDLLKNQGKLDDAGGVSYILDLATSLPDGVWITPESFRYWSKILTDSAQRRGLINLGYGLTELAHDKEQKDYIEQAQTELMALQEAFSLGESTSTGSMMDQALANIETQMNTPEGVTGLSTGLRSLDRVTHGFQPGQLISLGARPGGGKSALGMNIACHIATQEQKPILYFSLEMSGAELMQRNLYALAESNSSLSLLRDAREKMKASENLFIIEDRADLTLTAIQSLIQRTKATRPELGLIVIDHLALIASETDSHRRFQNRAYELGHMTRTLKMLAKSLKVPILLLCQLNREIENRQNKKPQLSDLRDTGSIEQDSDLVLFAYIDRDENRQPTGKAILSVAKQRNGVLGELPLMFIPHLTRFKESSKPLWA